ncbi:uncharacterized protein PHACADRAFT_254320 [Phanerochaete carnosa HHB-10118-sp]|uniref:Uncharacterized protein n=1 Tax=Phanerochaete carnosa (strain HHB-10118-sp) TaxID=650164 RepID=K5WD42_PHACS|nr:uncharacterized protein PHACADRAFT_254320 [Phanerochaete carnosa HHB-10118-sp]EKM56924.1 hypothetical protein PHACADRAFT_254320 [Phanerochaete carnosa HHB-10118-sp]
MNPRPTQPLYVIGLRSMLMYLREYCEIEDLGLDRDDGTGVETILSETIHWRGHNRHYDFAPFMPWQAETL